MGATSMDELQMRIYRVIVVLEKDNLIFHCIEEDSLWPRVGAIKRTTTVSCKNTSQPPLPPFLLHPRVSISNP